MSRPVAVSGSRHWRWSARERVWRMIGHEIEIRPVRVSVGRRRRVAVLWQLSTTHQIFDTYQQAMLTAGRRLR